MKLTEAKLVKRIQKGDQQAFGDLVNEYKDALFNIAYRMMGNRQEAEDVVQDTFLRVYTNIRQYDPNYKLSTWMYRIATNACIDRLRKKKVTDSLDEESEHDGTSLYYKLSSSEPTPEETTIRNEIQQQVQHAVDQLPPAYRAAILLKYLHDLSLQEISDILQIPVPTVKTRLHRGREALKIALEHSEEHAESRKKVRTV